MRSLTLGILFSLAAASFADKTVTLSFPDSGPYMVWWDKHMPTASPAYLTEIKERQTKFTVPGSGEGVMLFSLNTKTGNLAAKDLSKLGGSWNVSPADEKFVGRVMVRVEHGGQPVQAANVVLSSGPISMPQLLDPSAKGEVYFWGVPTGTVKVSVQVRSEGKNRTYNQSYELPLVREKPIPTLIVAIPDEVATVPPPSKGPQQDAAPSAKGPSGWTKFLWFLATLGLVGTAGYLLFRFMKSNSPVLKEKLEQLGVQVPSDDAPVDPVVDPVAPKAPEPQPQILLGAPDAVPAAFTPSGPIQPRLVAADGSVVSIGEGAVLVGRDSGIGISVPNESTVSRNHAELSRAGDVVTVRDLGSTNGTFVNGVKITDPVTLRPGDTVQFGQVRYRYEG